MSVDFYIYPRNYNLNTKYPAVGWKDRDTSGFYWTSSENGYFTGFWEGTPCKSGSCLVEAQTGASATDSWSVRCVANDDFKLSCGTGSYAPATQFCSGSTVYTLCGGKSYNPSTQFCSGTAAHPLCDGNTYNPSTQECVGTTLHSKCGTTLYLPSTHFCSGTTVYALCGGNTYNPASEECVSGVVTQKQALCGGEPYYLATHFCSGSTIYALCGGKTYNPATQECVDGILSNYQITCRDDFQCRNTVTLNLNECVEIRVLGYTDQYNLPSLIMRCETLGTQQSASVTLALNGTAKTYNGSLSLQAIVSLGKIELGDNELGTLCVTALNGATSVRCTGPGL
jgi:hypothetical protein